MKRHYEIRVRQHGNLIERHDASTVDRARKIYEIIRASAAATYSIHLYELPSGRELLCRPAKGVTP